MHAGLVELLLEDEGVSIVDFTADVQLLHGLAHVGLPLVLRC